MAYVFNHLMRKVFEKCAGNSGCDICRLHMEEDCLFFPELFHLNDRAQESGTPLCEMDLRSLIDLCTLCGLCPCQDIRMILIQAKAALNQEGKVPLANRVLSDVEKTGRWGTAFSRVLNPVTRPGPVQSIIKKALNIHPQRSLPTFPKESFFQWAKKRGLTSLSQASRRKVAYFVGCSAGYLFPEVGKAAVEILEHNGIPVFVPDQNCCGMPLIMEGDQKAALKKIKANMDSLYTCLQNGYDIVCSCPTCGYFYKNMLPENAYYSDAFQKQSGAGERVMKIPFRSKDKGFTTVPASIYQKILTDDDGYFSSTDPLMRINLSLNIKDMGEYLLFLHARGQLSVTLRFPDRPMVYFAPCHQREQGIGQPYYELIKSLPGADIIHIGGVMQCCGMGGHLGFKTGFHPHSVDIGQPVFDRLGNESFRTIITDCLSCCLQFEQVLSRETFHPLEMLVVPSISP